jgi:hypothetical protein
VVALTALTTSKASRYRCVNASSVTVSCSFCKIVWSLYREQYLNPAGGNVWTPGPSLLSPPRSHFGLVAITLNGGYLIAAGGVTGEGQTVGDITQVEAVDV